jgi:hypothetical protein
MLGMTRLEIRPTIAFDRWKFSIQTALDLDQLMLVVNGYLSGWSAEDASRLPTHLVGPITSSEELMGRAVDASRAEMSFGGPPENHPFLRELSLTLGFAAGRLRYLQALRSSGPA